MMTGRGMPMRQLQERGTVKNIKSQELVNTCSSMCGPTVAKVETKAARKASRLRLCESRGLRGSRPNLGARCTLWVWQRLFEPWRNIVVA